MKCKKEDCQKNAATGQAYCTREHAPLANYGAGQPTRSVKTGGYSTRELGALSRKSSPSERAKTPRRESATARVMALESASLDKSESGMSETWTESEPSPASDGDPLLQRSGLERIEDEWSIQKMIRYAQEKSELGMPSEEKIVFGSLPSTAIVVSPTDLSTAPLLSSNQAELASISLVNDVTERLHFQLKRLTLRADNNPVDPIEGSFQERQRVTLALKTASEIAKMIKLKLEAVKVFKDIE